MKDKILKYIEFINEDLAPKTLMDIKLGDIKSGLESLIPVSKDKDEVENKDDIEKISVRQAREKNEEKLTLKDLGLTQDSSEMLPSIPSTVDSLTFKFSDADSAYTLYISTEVKDANGAKSEEDIKKFNVELKKYILSTMEMFGSIGKNVEITSDGENNLKILEIKKEEIVPEGQGAPEGQSKPKSASLQKGLEEFIVDLKLEIDKKYPSGEEEFGIETE
jgi:hypothetical protein